MSMRALVSIGGYDVPAPSTYAATTATVVDSARNAKGYMVGAVIRPDVAKISLSWNYIEAQAWADLLARFDSKRCGKFINSVTFFNQDTNAWETRQMYVSDRVSQIFLRDKSGNIRGYTNVSLSLVEV